MNPRKKRERRRRSAGVPPAGRQASSPAGGGSDRAARTASLATSTFFASNAPARSEDAAQPAGGTPALRFAEPRVTDPKARDLFIVDNSISGWTGLRYLEEWAGIARAFDVATGYFEIRQLFSDGQIRDRDAAIRELAKELGYGRAGGRIHETLDNSLRTAVRRGVIANAGDGLAIDLRRIEDYERDFLKEQFLASLEGRAWKEREDAIRDFARWMGFRRTGPVIDDTSRSIINGLIREGRLESSGTSIRRCG